VIRVIKYVTRFGRKYCTYITEIGGYVAVRVTADVHWDLMQCTGVLRDDATFVIRLVAWVVKTYKLVM
jgi:hypothetical protein